MTLGRRDFVALGLGFGAIAVSLATCRLGVVRSKDLGREPVKKSDNARVDLVVERRLGELWALLEFINLGQQTICLNKFNLGSDVPDLQNNVFEFAPEGLVKYSGRYTKRAETKISSCVLLEPESRLRFESRLSGSYKIPSFRRLQVRYAAVHDDPRPGGALEYLVSNTVEIES